MELTAAHLRYLLAIYETARTQLDVSSRTIAERLGVTRPSVARALGQLAERGMIVKAHYGKIYLTDRATKTPLDLDPPLTAEERRHAALALTAALPERAFTGAYERLIGGEDAAS